MFFEVGLLHVWVVELGVGVGQLHAADKQLETLGDFRLVGLALGQRAEARGIVDHEGGLDQVVLDGFFPHAVEQVVVVDAFGLEAQLVALFDQRRVVAVVEVVVLVEQVQVFLAFERGVVHLHVAVGQFRSTADRLGQVAEELLGVVHHRVEVAVGLVELKHRELGVVAAVDAFVAEVAVDLEHPRHAGHQQALEVELWRDAQKQVDVQRVVVGLERPRGGAAGDGLHHGRFDF